MKFNIKSPLLTLAFAIFTLSGALAQAPQAIRYQGVARNTSGDPIISKEISIKLSILDDFAGDTIIYQETHKVTTSPLGLYNLSIGTGTPLKGKFSEIKWAGGDKFLAQEVNFGSGFEKLGTSQFLSVPFALYAASGNPGPAGTNGADGVSIKWLGTLSTPPDKASMNQAYYNSTDKKSYIFNGNIWQILTQDGANGLVANGAAAGNTPFWNGTEWITNNSNIFNNGANVGVGNIYPAEKLDVSGNISIPAANEYKYASTKLKYLSIPAIAFTYAPNTTTSTATGISAGSATGTTRYIAGGYSLSHAAMFAPVYLPDGATIKRVILFVYDNDAIYELSGGISKINLQTNTVTSISSTNYTNGQPLNTSLIAFANAVIDNSQNAYCIRFNTMEDNSNLKILGATVEYTVTKAD